MITASKQITSIPSNVWYVHVGNTIDSMWGSRSLARDRKAQLRNYGTAKIIISSSSITVGSIAIDTHS